ncbi:MAG: B12-binding domain-containing radical SAM protein [Planctomycetota bacterium]|jgi:hypothetical protein
MNKNILLISPASDNEALWVTGNEGPEVVNNIVPLGLATIAGLTPENFHVDIWDELVHGLIDDETSFERDYELVGITGYKSHLPRCRQLAEIFRKRSIPVALGGPGVSATPDDYRGYFDILFVGEAERIWPQFLREWQGGSYLSEYRQIETLDLAESPLPKWDSIAKDLSKYALGSVQTTRGCPFDCEFCDVVYLFGRHPRHKPIKNVLKEVRELERLGMRNVFFSDDEFIGGRRYAKDLLRALIPLNDSFSKPLSFSTQTTMNVSRDNELLELLAEAGFDLLFIGIETPNKQSLKEAHKFHNLEGDLVAEVHEILSYGIAVRAGMIVGFDHDDTDIFDIQYDFIQRAFLPGVGINMLKVPFGTKLWARLRQEGRVVSIPLAVRNKLGHSRSCTNIIPKLMTRQELMQSYRHLLERVYSWESFTERMHGFVSVVRRPPKVPQTPVGMEDIASLLNTLKVGPEGRKAVEDILKNTAQKAPKLMARVEALIVQHAKYRESINKLLPQIDRQIELESTGKLTFEVDRSPVPVPKAFKDQYKAIFPEIYGRIYLNLKDKSQIPEALVEVFVDFLVRCGQDFSHFEAHHRSFLNDICDRTCAKLDSQPPEDFVPNELGDSSVPNMKCIQLGDDILKTVEQTFLKIRREGSY